MCGIAGYIGFSEISRTRLETCLSHLKSRGPDDQGIYVKNSGQMKVGLVHTRLSIIDLDKRSAQPFRYGKYVFSYNGEIYNYLELRSELVTLGHKFQTQGDTEVLAAAWAEWGEKAFNRFDGMWAVAVFDTETEVLTLSTDPFGEKPLYYMKQDTGAVCFGSQINCVMTLGGRRPKPNWQHLKRFLVNGYKSLAKYEDSFVDGVFKVPGNRVINISISGMRVAPYWHIPKYQPNFNISREELVTHVRETLVTSISRRMRSDVPLAFCMSGGIDSNAIISVAASQLGLNVHGFTIVNRDGRYDERELVELSCHKLGIQSEKITLQPDNFVPALQKMVAARFGPVATISYYTQNYLHRAISEHGYKVAISGTGADELFSGYYDHHLLYLSADFLDANARMSAVNNWETHVKPLTRNPLLQDSEIYLASPGFRKHVFYKNEFYASFLKFDWHEPFVETVYCESLMRNRMLNELFHEAVPVILVEDDINAMSYSVENRSPFLSRDLLNLSLTIPDRELIQNGFAKSILRDAMKGLVPERILTERRKVGFNSSLFEVADIKSETLRELILDRTEFYDVVDRTKIEAFLGEDLKLNSDSKFLFNLINAKLTVDLMES